MHKQFFFLSPVEVVKVTSQNLEEVAAWCGGSVQETESRRVPGRMDKYVLVPTPKDTNISWAFPGMFITKRLVVTVKDELRETYAVFRRDYFDKNYFDTPKQAADKTWERQEAERNKPAKPTEVHVTVNVGQALVEAQKALEIANAKLVEAGVDPEELEEVTPVINAENLLTHNHVSTETCDENKCVTERYADGLHVFTDVTIETKSESEIPVEDLGGLDKAEAKV